MRSQDGDLVGVECINWDGDKQTFGSKGQSRRVTSRAPNTSTLQRAGPPCGPLPSCAPSHLLWYAWQKLRQKAGGDQQAIPRHRGHSSRGRRQPGRLDIGTPGMARNIFGGAADDGAGMAGSCPGAHLRGGGESQNKGPSPLQMWWRRLWRRWL